MAQQKRQHSRQSQNVTSQVVTDTDEWAVGNVEDTRDRVRRLASDTADYLIVHDDGSDGDDQSDRDDKELRTLRERVDSGEYGVIPENVAEAMVERVHHLQGKDED